MTYYLSEQKNDVNVPSKVWYGNKSVMWILESGSVTTCHRSGTLKIQTSEPVALQSLASHQTEAEWDDLSDCKISYIPVVKVGNSTVP
jgi:hypothetical protein